jgi:hypothetical protein
MSEASEIAAIARIHHAEDLLRAARQGLEQRANPGFRGPKGYRPARVPLGMSPEGAGTFAKWDADRLASKEADAQERRAAAYSAIAAREAAERGVVLAAPGEPEPVRIPAKIGMMSKIPMGGAAKKAWKLRSAERGMRASGWLKGPTIIKSNRGRKRRSTRSRPRHRNGRFKKLLRARRKTRNGRKQTRCRVCGGFHSPKCRPLSRKQEASIWRGILAKKKSSNRRRR